MSSPEALSNALTPISSVDKFDFGGAARDVARTVQSYRVWNLLALQDTRQRYRRSVLGPFWITLSTFAAIGALALVYTNIFNIPASEYLPFLAVGFIFWSFLSGVLLDSCTVFIQAEGIIKQVSLPYGVHVLRMIWRNVILLAHHSIVLVAVLFFMGVNPGLDVLFLLPALALTLLSGVSLGYLLGGLCARYRDISPIIASLATVLFYVTPVIYKPTLLKGHAYLLSYNPFFHFLEILRSPLLGHEAPLESWLAAAAITVVLAAVTLLFLARYRRRIAFWL